MKTKLLAILLLIQGYSYSQNKVSFMDFNKALNRILNSYSTDFDDLKGAKTDNDMQREWYSKVNLAGCENGKLTLGLLMTHNEWRAQIIKTMSMDSAKKKFNDFSEVLDDCTYECCKMKRTNFSESLNKSIAFNKFSMWTVDKLYNRKNDKMEDATIYLDIRQLDDKSYLVSISIRSKKDNGQ